MKDVHLCAVRHVVETNQCVHFALHLKMSMMNLNTVRELLYVRIREEVVVIDYTELSMTLQTLGSVSV